MEKKYLELGLLRGSCRYCPKNGAIMAGVILEDFGIDKFKRKFGIVDDDAEHMGKILCEALDWIKSVRSGNGEENGSFWRVSDLNSKELPGRKAWNSPNPYFSGSERNYRFNWPTPSALYGVYLMSPSFQFGIPTGRHAHGN